MHSFFCDADVCLYSFKEGRRKAFSVGLMIQVLCWWMVLLVVPVLCYSNWIKQSDKNDDTECFLTCHCVKRRGWAGWGSGGGWTKTNLSVFLHRKMSAWLPSHLSYMQFVFFSSYFCFLLRYACSMVIDAQTRHWDWWSVSSSCCFSCLFFSFLPKLHSIAIIQSAVVPVVCATTTWFQIHKTENGVDIDLWSSLTQTVVHFCLHSL